MLTSDELCDALQISRSKLDGLIAKGVPFIRVSSTKRYRLEEVLDWMRSRTEEAA